MTVQDAIASSTDYLDEFGMGGTLGKRNVFDDNNNAHWH